MFTKLCRLGRDAELKHTANGDAVLNLALAYNYGRKDNSGNRPTQWVDAALWGKRAESLEQYMLKGTAVVVTLDDVYVHTFEKKDGTQGSTLRGTVVGIDFAGSKSDTTPAERQQPAPAPSKAAAPAGGGSGFDDFPDDTPFNYIARGLCGAVYWG